MIEFVKNPNLPDKKISKLICGSSDELIIDYIKSFNIEIIKSDLNALVDNRIANHADVNVFHVGGANIILDSTQVDLRNNLAKIGMCTVTKKESARSEYPFDCALNAAVIGEFLFANQKALCDEIRESFSLEKSKLINVSQGYAKCSTLIVDPHSFITDDPTIYHAGINVGFDCLLIGKGSIALNGFSYGFIGGAGGLIDKAHLIFFGVIRLHDDFEKINDFLCKRHCRYSFLQGYPLTDIGGIVPLCYGNTV